MTSTLSHSLTITQLLKQSERLLVDSDSARLDAELLLAFVLKKERSYFYTWPEKIVNDNDHEQFSRILERRVVGEPIAHILGEKDFWTLTLSVNNTTLIPRADTEVLVEKALTLFSPKANIHVLDLGTGTGAIALALASECPQWRITAVDKYSDACALAEKNRQYYQLNNVTVQQSDWCNDLGEMTFDMIVSNPPYIDKTDHHLQQGDVKFEPLSALTASHQGLSDFQTIVQQAPQYLSPNGFLLFEHGYQQAEAVTIMLQNQGFSDCFTVNDIAGHPRVTGGRL